MNDQFRSHVTDTAFNLTLSKSHIAKLVELAELRAVRWKYDKINHNHRPRDRRQNRYERAFSNTVTGSQGLQERGLIIWNNPSVIILRSDGKYKYIPDIPPNKIWQITKAGDLVIALLKEAGIYEEYAKYIRLEAEVA